MNTVKKMRAAPPARRRRRSWREKLADDKDLPKVITIGPKQRASWGEGTCAIPSPREIDSLMRRVPRGMVTTINELRGAVARRHGANIGCPITTGIFAWIAAHAAEEAAAAGEQSITPYWRTLKAEGELNPKYPGGIPAQAARLQAEGHTVARRGKRSFVCDFEHSLAKL
jgi:alkylated DNA nucleotide flippase Atl1